MNNKKVQAQMQIDVSFVGNTTKLVKDLQTSMKQIDLGSSLAKNLETELNRSFKDTLSNLGKLSEGLSKKGLSPKQYTEFFNGINAKIQESTRFIGSFKESLQGVFNSKENKDAIKDLDNYKKKLEEINKLVSSQKGSQTRQNTAISKLKEDTGLDYNISKKTLNDIARRRKNKQGLTKNQSDWVSANGLDESKLNRALDLLKQINAQSAKINEQNEKAKKLTGQSNAVSGQEYVQKQVNKLSDTAISDQKMKQWIDLLNQLDGLIKMVTNSSEALEANMNVNLPRATAEAEKLAKATSTLREILGQFGIVFSAATIVRGFQDLTRSAFEFYKSLDSALNEIYVVSNLTSSAVNDLKSNFINMAKQTGMSIDDVTRSAVLFYQQGLNTQEVLTMTEVTSQFAKVAGIDATDAADKLTAAVNGYCLAASDASEVADKFNKVAAASAADINELSTAFSKAAAQANQAGVSMDNYLAYIATMEEATREAPENIGTGLKTIFSRMQQIKTGDNTEDDTDVNKVETALKSVGVQLRNTQGELRDLEEVFDELGPKWQTLDRNTQAYLGTIIAGTRQQSRFITLMQNWDRVLDLSEQSANSAGMQALMHAKAMDSIESKVQQFQVTWQEFVSNLASSDLFKGLITGLTKLLNVFSSGNKPVMLLATSVGLLATKLKDLQEPLVKKGKDIAKTFRTIFNTTKGNIFTSQEEKDAALEGVQKKKLDVQSKMDVQSKKLNELTQNLANTKAEEEQKRIAQEREQVEQEIVRLKKEENQLDKEEKNISEQSIMSKKEAVGKGLIAAGTALNIAGMAVGQKDDNLAGVMGSVGSAATAIGQFATGNWIGGIASTATAAYQIFETVDKWDENIKARVDEAVNNVSESLETVVNHNTGIRSTEALLKQYDSLSKKLHRTTAEQETLNDTIQQLGDTYGIDVLSDAYGNLAIDINEVNKALEEQESQKEKAMEELDKKERESMTSALTGLGNDTTVSEYTKQLFSSTRSQYKSLLSGIEDGLTDETRPISKNVAQALSANLKTSITNEISNNSDEYIVQGFGKGITKFEKDLNAAMGSDTGAWTDLYAKIDFLQQNIDDMTFDQAQDYLNNYFDTWGDKIGLTQQQWDVLKDSINKTVFKNESLLEFFNMVNELQNKGSDDYWENEEDTGKLDRLEKELREAYDDYNSKVSDVNKAGQGNFVGLNTADGNSFEEYVDNLRNGKDSTYGYGVNDVFRLSEGDEAADTLDNVAKAYQQALKEREEFYQNYSDEHNLDGVEDAQAYIGALNTISDTLQNLNQATLDYMGTIENLYSVEGMKGNEAAQYAATLEQAMNSIEKLSPDSSNADKFDVLSRYYEQNKDSMKESVKEKWESVLKEAFDELSVSTPISLKAIGTELQDISKDLMSMNDLIAEFSENGSLALDSFIELADIIDSINLDDLGKLDPSGIDAYIQAIDNLNLAYDQNTGQITMNADSLATLQDIQELQTKSKLAGMIADLKASKATTETQIAYIDAQIAATDAAIEAANVSSGTVVTADKIKGSADEEYSTIFSELVGDIVDGYENDVTNQGQWSTAILSNLGKVADAWSKYYTGIREGSTQSLDSVKQYASDILNGSDYKWEGSSSFSGIDWDKYKTITGGSEEQKQLIADLNAYKTKLENSKKSYQATLDLTTKEIGLLENMYNSDLSKLGSKTDKGKELQDYIGKLKEIFNIQNRIAMLEHRIGTIESYDDIAKGDQYGKYFGERLRLTEELTNQYAFLTEEQKKFTNGYKEFIESSAVGDVFDFDQYGQIIINFEKYNALQDKAISGEKSLKEQADELYEAYTSMFDELKDDFDNYVKYLKQTIDLQQEAIDAYKDMEEEAAAAVKEIYQKILNDKLEAIDKEKEALQDLKKAREEANKDQSNAKEVSGLQTNLQRAMLDTSGASDSAAIKAQQDLDDKLDAIAEDKYSQMLQNLEDQLEDEKEALQDNFDILFENTDWMFEGLESDILGNKEALIQLLQQTDDWNTKSFTQRHEALEDWNTKFATYKEYLDSDGGIKGVISAQDANRLAIEKAEEVLKTQVANTGVQIANAVRQGISSAYNSGYSSGSSSNSGGHSYYNGSPDSGNKTTDNVEVTGDVPEVKEYKNSITNLGGSGAYAKWIGKTVEVKGSADVTKYNDDGSTAGTAHNPWGYNPNVKITAIGKSKEGGYFAKIKDTSNFKADNKWIPISVLQTTDFFGQALSQYATGGFNYTTGPAWLDGTSTKPEAVLNALQTKHFIDFTNSLDKMYGANINGATPTSNSSINIDTISFNVASMSSEEDGEKAFNMFVDKFKEIGNHTGLNIQNYKNNL